MFHNVAPVAPECALAALERALFRADTDATAIDCKKYCGLLRSLAYDAALFERAVGSLVRIVTAEDVTAGAHGTQAVVSLFHLILSGTRAIVEQRAAVVDLLLSSPDRRRRVLGVLALKALLEALYFLPISSFDFGARSRDFGYWPRTREEIQHWFGVSLRLVESFGCGNGPVAPEVRAGFAEKFRGLWLQSGSRDEIVRVCIAIRNNRFWPEGWLAVRQVLDLDGKGFDDAERLELIALETALRPADLVQKVRAIVFSAHGEGVDFEDFEDHSTEDIGRRMARTEAVAQDLGKAVATESEILTALLPEIVSSDGRLWSFGQGLVVGASDRHKMWRRLVSTLGATEESARKPQVLLGFMHQLRSINPALAAALLDESVEHDTLAGVYPLIQIAVDLGAQDIARLKHSLAVGKAPANAYRNLVYGRATDRIPARDLGGLILAIAKLPFGQDVAIQILQMRLHSERDRGQEPAAELVDAGCGLLKELKFTQKSDLEDYRLGEICADCLKGEQGAAVVFGLCERFKNAVAKYETSAYAHDDMLKGLFTAQPSAALDGLCGGDAESLELGLRVLRDGGIRRRPLDSVCDKDLLSWCDREPQVRYPAMAGVISILKRTGEQAPPSWTSIALRFLESAPDASAILRIFTFHFMPSGVWCGSRGTIVESNAKLLDQLGAYPALKNAVIEEKERVREWIEEERRRETLWDRERDERFE
jgi:hypothetical protein